MADLTAVNNVHIAVNETMLKIFPDEEAGFNLEIFDSEKGVYRLISSDYCEKGVVIWIKNFPNAPIVSCETWDDIGISIYKRYFYDEPLPRSEEEIENFKQMIHDALQDFYFVDVPRWVTATCNFINNAYSTIREKSRR